MLKKVLLKKKRLDDYVPVIGYEETDRIKKAAAPLKGIRVLHVNATSYGGGVAELLNSTAPLLNDLGIEADWALLCKEDPFFEVTKGFHNALQGKPYSLNSEKRSIYLNRNKHCAEMLDQDYDIIMIHDPQPAALREFCGKGKAKWIWRCHIDTSHPDKVVWEFLRPFVELYDAAVYTMRSFVPPDLALKNLRMIAPAIDPFTSKNIDLDEKISRTIVAEFGIDLARPVLLQVSRFDPWKDPLGVLEVYKKVKNELPELQLAYIGSMADDDPEGWEIYRQVQERAKGDKDIFLYTNLQGVNAFEVNCFQRMADVVIQKSVREGFGLVVSEALWKGAAMVAGNVGGIPLQIEDGVSGFLAKTTDEFADKVAYLFRHKEERQAMGEKGRESVRNAFLIPRLVREEIELYRDLLERDIHESSEKGGV